MHVAILTFDRFNELDSIIAYTLLSRIALLGDPHWRVSIAAPTAQVTSMNGLTLNAHIDLEEACRADAVWVGSSLDIMDVCQSAPLMATLRALNPRRQLLAAQCSGTYLLAKLGLLEDHTACTDNTSKPWVVAAGIKVLNQPFRAVGNVATAGGCLASSYLAAWLIARLKGQTEAREVLHNFAPVGEKDEYVKRAFVHIGANLETVTQA